MKAPQSSRFSQIAHARDVVRARLPRDATPRLGLVLGSGLGQLGRQLSDITTIAYRDVPGLPVAHIAGHQGALIFGTLGKVPVICLSGRVHLYEGHSPDTVVFGARLLAALGARAVILTNAAGGIAKDCTPGKLMLIEDHLNLTGQNPLIGPNEERWGERFVDMSNTYHPSLQRLALETAKKGRISLASGVYAGMLGPTYETPAEVRMIETLGASAVGMSTVHEAIALHHQGVAVLGLSCITNYAAGKSDEILRHEDVKRIADAASESFCSLVSNLVQNIPDVL